MSRSLTMQFETCAKWQYHFCAQHAWAPIMPFFCLALISLGFCEQTVENKCNQSNLRTRDVVDIESTATRRQHSTCWHRRCSHSAHRESMTGVWWVFIKKCSQKRDCQRGEQTWLDSIKKKKITHTPEDPLKSVWPYCTEQDMLRSPLILNTHKHMNTHPEK